MNNKELIYKIGITLIPKIGSILAKRIIAYTGSIEGVFNEKKRNLVKIPGIGDYLAKEIANQNVLKRAENEITFIERYGIKPLFYLDNDYPQRLKNCEDGPVLIYVKGNADLNRQKIISIVGTRSATSAGKELCNSLLNDISAANHNAIIVSGLAYGIDIYAHKAALKYNLPTIAVLAHGLDTIYPPAHKNIAKEMLREGGALISEFLSQTKIDRNYFLQRNRIIAGLSDATIVVESAIKGGALVTANIANSYNRDVFAFPGRISDKFSAGCNHLIKTNRAALIETGKDLEYILGWETDQKTKTEQINRKELFVSLTEEEKQILKILRNEGNQSIDYISAKVEIPSSKVSVLLLNLEFSGLVKTLPGKVFSLA